VRAAVLLVRPRRTARSRTPRTRADPGAAPRRPLAGHDLFHRGLPLGGVRGLRHVPAAVGARARRQRHARRLDHHDLPPPRSLPPGGLGGFRGGWLAARFGGRRVVVTSFAAAAPLYALFFVLPAPVDLLALIFGYFVLQASLPVNVVLGQELSPRHAGIISSL